MTRFLVLAPAVLLLSACGGSSTSPKPAGPALQTIHVSEKEFSITPRAISLPQNGTYAFQITNTGAITHAFEIEGHGVKARSGDIQPGQTMTLTVKLSTKGSYDAYCPIDGHRSKGMQATVTGGIAAPSGTTTVGTTGQTTTTTSTKPSY